jgi:hypothetical protein
MPSRHEYTVALPGEVTIALSAQLELNQDAPLLLGAYLPDVVLHEGLSSDATIYIHHTESTEQSLRQHDKEITIKDAWQGIFPADLPHLLYCVARANWVRRNIFPVHAACVQKQYATLLPGNSGTGKTTTALRLADEYGFKIQSGNTTLVRFNEQGMEAFAGTRTMTLATADFNLRRFESARHVSYGDRTAFIPPPEYYADGTAQTIGSIALIRLTDYASHYKQLAPVNALHRLYTHFLDSEREDAMVCDGQALYTGNDQPASRIYLAQSLRKALTTMPVADITGTPTFITGRLAA